jgi:hypothetical protein
MEDVHMLHITLTLNQFEKITENTKVSQYLKESNSKENKKENVEQSIVDCIPPIIPPI